MCVCVGARVYMWVRVCLYGCVCVCVGACVFVCVGACVYVTDIWSSVSVEINRAVFVMMYWAKLFFLTKYGVYLQN